MIKRVNNSGAKGFANSFLLIFAYLLFFVTITLQAFDPELPASRYLHRAWTTANGLPQSTVYAILQTRDHFLWIGTEGGLARFDGASFTVFQRNDPPVFLVNAVTALGEDAKGGLWIGTYGGGLLQYERGKFTRFDEKDGLSSKKIWSLLPDITGRLWIGTVGGGLQLLENGRVTRTWNRGNGLVDDTVLTLAAGTDGSIWAGTGRGLCRIVDGRVQTFTTAQGLTSAAVVKLFIDRGGTLWAATSRGLNRRRGERFEIIGADPALQITFVRSFAEDRQGRIFLGTENGLFQLRNSRVQKVAAGSLLTDLSLMAVLCDREDNLWLGTSAGGLNALRQSPLQVFTSAQGLSGNRILALLQDSGGNVWAGAQGQGLNRFDGSRWRPFPFLSKVGGISVTALLEDGHQRLWIGTAGHGLLELADGALRVYNERDGLVADAIHSLAQSPDGKLWIGTSAGLFALNQGRIESFTHAGPLANPVFALACDAQGRLFCGAKGPCLCSYFAGQWQKYAGLEGQTVFAVYLHADGTLWAGTENGLFRRSGDRFVSCRLHGTAADIQVFGMAADLERRLWLSTDKGIGCIEAEALANAPAFGGFHLPVRFFGEAEGMKSTVGSSGIQPAIWRGSDGRLWFSTQNGVVVIEPQQALRRSPVLAPQIEKVAADGRTVEPTRVPARTRRLEIFFTAPFFSAPQHLRFKYRLQGFDRGWRLTGGRSASYDDLRPGRYFFQLQPVLHGMPVRNALAPALQVELPRASVSTAGLAAAVLFLAGLLAAGWTIMIRRRAGPITGTAKYRSSNLDATQGEAYREKLAAHMGREKPHLDPALSLATLAEQLAMPAKHLSQVINEHWGQNFNDFINSHRIQAAIARLSDLKNRDDKLLKIAFESGFNSKSVFNAAFKKHTGFSPSEFRQRLLVT